jgi:Beta-propeller repeat/HYDIN/CFA65/VesB-like, Ig-like domain
MLNIVFSLLLTLAGYAALLPSTGSHPITSPQKASIPSVRLVNAYRALPLRFEPNRGQSRTAAKYLAHGTGYTLFLQPDAAIISLRIQNGKLPAPGSKAGVIHGQNRLLKMQLVGANPSAEAVATDKLPGVSNYFLGRDPRRWISGIPTYGKVRFSGVYPGIDLVYYGSQNQLEYDFALAKASDVRQLCLQLQGGDFRLDAEGNLLLDDGTSRFILHKPVAYQPGSKDPRERRYVAANFDLRAHGMVRFKVHGEDPSEPLVVDPMLGYATYLGGSQGDSANAVAVDSTMNAYITGTTSSSNFPTASSYRATYSADGDAFVSKISDDGTTLVYSTFLGGSSFDTGNSIFVDSSGDAYVAGTTSSTDFPTTSSGGSSTGAFQTALAGVSDAFVIKLDPSGQKLLFSTYLGGEDADSGDGVAADTAGNVYVTGTTQSLYFPTKNPIQAGNDGASDTFIVKLVPNFTAMVYGTYIGGSQTDVAQGIALDGSGEAYVTGYTSSSNFPTVNPLQPAIAGRSDAFVYKVSSDGSQLVYSTFIGGTAQDRGFGIAVDNAQDVYLTGDTQSTTTTLPITPSNPGFPVSVGAFQGVNNGGADAFILEINPPGSAILFSTLLGGSANDTATSVAFDSSGNAYITGYTQSPDFPTANAVQASFGGGTCGSSVCTDAFVVEVNNAGTSLVYSTYLGGSGADFGAGIAVDTDTNAYVAGSTTSPNFTPTAGAYQGTPGDSVGNGDAFVAMISHTNSAAIAISPQKLNYSNQAINTPSNPQTVYITNVGTSPLSISSITMPTDFAETDNCVGTVAAGGGRCTMAVVFTPTTLENYNATIEINDNATNSPHDITVTGVGVNPSTTVTFSPTSLSFGAQTVNTTSAPQTVTLTNTGQTDLNITNIATTGDFAETNNCPTTLAAGASCTFSVTFTPTATSTTPGGTVAGTLTVTDNATPSTQSVGLRGLPSPIFSLNSTQLSQVTEIGTTSVDFTVRLNAPSTFTDSVTLSCASGATCTFSPTTLTLGQSSTVTVSGLSASSANPFNFQVIGTDVGSSGTQTAGVSLQIYFQDFTLSVSPNLNSVTAGQGANYVVTVSPLNGFAQSVLLSCPGTLPTGVTCTFTPSGVTLTGTGAVTSTLSVATTARSGAGPRPTPPPPRGNGRLRILGLLFLGSLLLLLGWAARNRRTGAPAWRYGWAARFCLLLACLTFTTALWTGCNDYYYTNVIQQAPTAGTPVGNYTVLVEGTFNGTGSAGSSSTVNRTTTFNIAVN